VTRTPGEKRKFSQNGKGRPTADTPSPGGQEHPSNVSQLETSLRDRESRLKAILQASPDLIFVVSQDGIYLDCHSHDPTLFALPPSKFLGKSIREIHPEPLATLFLNAYAEVMATRQMRVVEYPLELPDGPRYFEARITLMDDMRLLSTVSDVTDRKRREADLQRLQMQMAQAQRLTGIGSWEYEVTTNRLFWSDETFRIFGVPPHQGHETYESFMALVHPDDRDQAAADYQQALAAPLPTHVMDHRIIRPDNGKVRQLREQYTLVRDDQGRPVRSFGVVRDITEEQWAEAQLRQAQKLESIGLLAGGIAHDFNNILQIILGSVELAEQQVDPASSVAVEIHEIHRAALRSLDITRQLLGFARRQPIAPLEIDLEASARDILPMLQRLWPICMDPGQVQQIFTNLCVNAVDAIQGSGTIEIRLYNVPDGSPPLPGNLPAAARDFVCLSFRDTGCGMAPQTVEHIFEPFFSTKGKQAGTGLGLATVYGIVHQNGGFIEVESAEEKGACFRLFLPRHLGEST